MINMRFTDKPAKEEGFYWLKDNSGVLMPAQALDTSLREWSTLEHNGILKWSILVSMGYSRSIKQIKP